MKEMILEKSYSDLNGVILYQIGSLQVIKGWADDHLWIL